MTIAFIQPGIDTAPPDDAPGIRGGAWSFCNACGWTFPRSDFREPWKVPVLERHASYHWARGCTWRWVRCQPPIVKQRYEDIDPELEDVFVVAMQVFRG